MTSRALATVLFGGGARHHSDGPTFYRPTSKQRIERKWKCKPKAIQQGSRAMFLRNCMGARRRVRISEIGGIGHSRHSSVLSTLLTAASMVAISAGAALAVDDEPTKPPAAPPP